MNAICIQCGTFKSDFQDQCPSCSFTPEEDIDIVKSRILGPPYTFTFGEDGETVETGRTQLELEAIAQDIMQGKKYIYSEEEISGVMEAYLPMKNMPPREFRMLILQIFLIFIVGVVGLIFLVYIIWSWPR